MADAFVTMRARDALSALLTYSHQLRCTVLHGAPEYKTGGRAEL
jgi:hypothetical protein